MTASSVSLNTLYPQTSAVYNLENYIENLDGSIEEGSFVTMTVGNARKYRNRQRRNRFAIGAAIGAGLPLVAFAGGIGVLVGGMGIGIDKTVQCAAAAAGTGALAAATVDNRASNGSEHSVKNFSKPVLPIVGKVLKTFISTIREIPMALVEFTVIQDGKIVTDTKRIPVSELVVLKNRFYNL